MCRCEGRVVAQWPSAAPDLLTQLSTAEARSHSSQLTAEPLSLTVEILQKLHCSQLNPLDFTTFICQNKGVFRYGEASSPDSY